MVVAQRWDYRRLRAARAARSSSSRSGCSLAVLVDRRRSERRPPLDLARPGRVPALRAREARARVWAAAYLSRRPPPRSLRELARPVGLLDGRLRRAAPGRARSRHRDRRSSPCSRRCCSSPGRRPVCSALPLAIVGALGALMIWVEPYQRARLLTFLHPWRDRAGRRLPDRPGADRDGLRRHLRRRARQRGRRSSSICPRRRPT